MNITDGFDDDKWDELRRRLEPFSRSRLWSVRRADRLPEDAVNSAFRTFFDRLQNGESRPKRRRDPTPETEEDVLRLLFKHLRRKIRASYEEESTQKRSAKRSGDVSLEEAIVFFNEFETKGALTDSDLELFYRAALEPISHFDEEMQELAIFMLQGYTPKEIAEATGKTLGQIYPAIAHLRKRVKDLESESE
jgi:DNA-directed RNA polymerase specialized sigma24 family protein